MMAVAAVEAETARLRPNFYKQTLQKGYALKLSNMPMCLQREKKNKNCDWKNKRQRIVTDRVASHKCE